MAALKKSGEEEWKKKIPRLKTSIVNEKSSVLDSIVTTLEENNKNNNTTSTMINNRGDNFYLGKYLIDRFVRVYPSIKNILSKVMSSLLDLLNS